MFFRQFALTLIALETSFLVPFSANSDVSPNARNLQHESTASAALQTSQPERITRVRQPIQISASARLLELQIMFLRSIGDTSHAIELMRRQFRVADQFHEQGIGFC